jgi:hypothetical protein
LGTLFIRKMGKYARTKRLNALKKERIRLQNAKNLKPGVCESLVNVVEEFSVLENATTMDELRQIEVLWNWWNTVGCNIYKLRHFSNTEGIKSVCTVSGCFNYPCEPEEIQFDYHDIPVAPGLPFCDLHSAAKVQPHIQQTMAAILLAAYAAEYARIYCMKCGRIECDKFAPNWHRKRVCPIELEIEWKNQKDMMDTIFTLQQPVAEEISYYLGYGIDASLVDEGRKGYEGFYECLDVAFCRECDHSIRANHKLFWSAIQ